jgi:hypothetical protein
MGRYRHNRETASAQAMKPIDECAGAYQHPCCNPQGQLVSAFSPSSIGGQVELFLQRMEPRLISQWNEERIVLEGFHAVICSPGFGL